MKAHLDFDANAFWRALGLPIDTPDTEIMRVMFALVGALAAGDEQLARAARNVLARHRERPRVIQ